MRARWRSCRICEISRPGLTAPKSERSRLPARATAAVTSPAACRSSRWPAFCPSGIARTAFCVNDVDRREQVGGQGLRQRDAQGTRDDGERQRLVAGGAAGTHQLPVVRQVGGRKDLGADLQQPGAHLGAGLAQLPGQQLGRQQRIQFGDGNILVEEPDGQRVRVGQLLRPRRRTATPRTTPHHGPARARCSFQTPASERTPRSAARNHTAAAGPAGRARG